MPRTRKEKRDSDDVQPKPKTKGKRAAGDCQIACQTKQPARKRQNKPDPPLVAHSVVAMMINAAGGKPPVAAQVADVLGCDNETKQCGNDSGVQVVNVVSADGDVVGEMCDDEHSGRATDAVVDGDHGQDDCDSKDDCDDRTCGKGVWSLSPLQEGSPASAISISTKECVPLLARIQAHEGDDDGPLTVECKRQEQVIVVIEFSISLASVISISDCMLVV